MRRFLLFTLFAACALGGWAVPAHPQPQRVLQPDGTYVTIRLHGDEWNHFHTTDDGYSVVRDHRGFYVYADLQDGLLKPTARVAHDIAERTAAEKAFLSATRKMQAPAMLPLKAAMKQQVEQREAAKRQQLHQPLSSRRAQDSRRVPALSNFKGLIILLQFNDREFSRADYKDIMTNMINKKGYTGYDEVELTGSVYDYFNDNSDGRFQPTFDLVGPITVDYSQYDGNDKDWRIVIDALKAVDDQIDYSQYDGDGDGVVDMVYFIVAGFGQNFDGNDGRLWWPYRSVVYDYDTRKYIYLDGVKLGDYASSVELYGWESKPESVMLDAIGTICHEFSHVLGLPDFYDTDYEKSGGESNTPGKWSVMDDGCYRNKDRTPVGYSLYERYSVGFMDAPEVLDNEGSYTLKPLPDGKKGYRIPSPNTDEFFLLENRQKTGFKWDAYLPGSGLLVHRVDLSDPTVWSKNKVNITPSRNYYELVRACGAANSSTAYDVFPGKGEVTTLDGTTTPANLKTWDGKKALRGLRNITMDGQNITFDLFVTHTGDVNGDFKISVTDALILTDQSGDNPATPSDIARIANYILNDAE